MLEENASLNLSYLDRNSSCEVADIGSSWIDSDKCTFWVEGVIMVAVGSIGLIGNSLSILTLVFTKDRLNNVFHRLLLILTCIDTVQIILVVLDYSLVQQHKWPVTEDSPVYVYLLPYLLFPLYNIDLSLSTYLTMAMACERYLAVCHPFYYRQVCADHSLRHRTLIYVVPVVILSFGVNIPRFLELETIEQELEIGTLNDLPTVTWMPTELRKNPLYVRIYINCCRFLLTGLIPFAVLSYLNRKIFLGVKYSHVRPSNKARNEVKMASILLNIVFFFLICNSPRIILNGYESYLSEEIFRCPETAQIPEWFACLTSFSHFLIICSSSVNFYIYSSFTESLISKFLLLPLKSKLSRRLMTIDENVANKKEADMTMTTTQGQDAGRDVYGLNRMTDVVVCGHELQEIVEAEPSSVVQE